MNLRPNERLSFKRIRPKLKPICGDPDLLPFINVFFLLLIFFMMGSSFVPVSGIPVNLPETASLSTGSVKKYIITLDQNGKIYFNDTVMDDLKQLKGKLLSDIPGGFSAERDAVVLRADRANSFETVAGIMALAEELKLNIFILARKSDSERTVFTETDRR